MSHFLHWCYTWIALLSANQNRVIFSCILLSKWVKWNISVEHEIVFPRLNFLWDDWITLRCFFLLLFVCLFFSVLVLRYIFLLLYIFFEMFVSEIIYFIHQILVILQSVWHSFSLIYNLLVLTRRVTAIVLWAKLFGCEKLNRRAFKLLGSCVSLC